MKRPPRKVGRCVTSSRSGIESRRVIQLTRKIRVKGLITWIRSVRRGINLGSENAVGNAASLAYVGELASDCVSVIDCSGDCRTEM